MCFSATASFVASGGLAVVGTASLRAAQPKERIVAAIPLLFAAQQALEGIQWLALNHGTICSAAGYGFLTFAYVLWPVYIPGMVYLLDPTRRWIIRWFFGLGIGAAFWNLWYLIHHTLTISVFHGHIAYDLGIFQGEGVAVFYVIAVSGALLVSDIPLFAWGGLAALTTAAMATVLARATFPSVWCLFAAVASSIAYLYVTRQRKKRLNR